VALLTFASVAISDPLKSEEISKELSPQSEAVQTEAQRSDAGQMNVNKVEPVSELVRLVREGVADVNFSRGLNETELNVVRNFYKSNTKFLWVDETGIKPKVLKTIAELSNASDYGLPTKLLSIPVMPVAGAGIQEKALLELALTRSVLLYARFAKGGRILPSQVGSQLNHVPAVLPAEDILSSVTEAEDFVQFLRGLHPKNSQFTQLREKLLELRNANADQQRVKIPAGPILRPGISHAQIALLRQRLQDIQLSGEQSELQRYDPELVKKVKAFQTSRGLNADGIIGNGTRKALNGQNPHKLIKKILMNMERWRWLPDALDENTGIYVWANIPEFRVRIIQREKRVFSERSIVGKVSHKTPVFSDRMEWVEIHPVWYIPNSIKVHDILPSLRRPTSSVMQRYNLKVNCGAYGSNYKKINWNTVDIRNCSFTQPPGRASVLGDFKFKFPNKYSVYMHDTHKPALFRNVRRSYSHGCIRVKQPRRMAEILLDHDKGMTSKQLGRILDGPQKPHKEDFNKPVPVHITYFTTYFDDNGNFQTSSDLYGHDRQLARVMGL
ncbi:MAG: L,D-transpeptidase family protein, partial [Methyloligellaceae bacterium]